MASHSSLEGKVAYVTGSTRGIGNAIARSFAAAGAAVVVNGRASRDAVEALAAELTERHGTACLAAFADQRDQDAVKRVFQDVFATYGRLDILVNNAGILDDGLLGMIAESSVDDSFAVNTLALIRNMQSAARLMRRTGSGSIINISSIIGTRGNPGEVVYGATKAAVVGMTLSAAKELAPAGIRVNAIAPGFIDTDLTRSLPPARFEERLASVGMGRIGTPQDVANVALFLASDASAYVTGQVIGVDGSMVI
ncbi:MAG: 3-oxoacyl-[acyl-carrier protein] reductase [Chloroflexota bacterium]|jgi:3-oxoacyl-[acyl-carrier protein] reductase|nr:3-oxoacyl-[acyl-carrier protein] reductase [Chloroflexota bacterium]